MVRAVGKRRMLPAPPKTAITPRLGSKSTLEPAVPTLGAAESSGLSSRPNPVPPSRRRLFIIVE
jgi:hypothetical protein